ncbi:MAG: hypothetical protein ABSH35_04035 [Isosphaeraceae bacterium]
MFKLAAIQTRHEHFRETIDSFGHRLPEVAFGLAVVAQAVAVLAATYFPYCDAPVHLSRWVMLNRYWSGDPLAGVVLIPRASNSLLSDLLGAGMVRLLGPQYAIKLVVVTLALLPGAGMYALLCTVAPRLRGWGLVGLLLGLNRYLMLGFLNYQLALGLLLFWLALYFRFKPRLDAPRIMGLTAFGVVLSQVHMSSIAILVLVVGSDALIDAIAAYRRRDLNRALRSLLLPLCILAVPLLIVALTPSGQGGQADAPNVWPYEFRTPINKFVHLLSPFFTNSLLDTAIFLIGYLASVATFVWFVCRPGRWTWSILAVALLLFCFAIFPVSIRGTYDVDVRFLIPAYLLVFISVVPIETEYGLGRKGLLVPLLACLIHDGSFAIASRTIDGELARYKAILERIPPGKTVHEIVLLEPHFRMPTYYQFDSWYVVEKHGRVSGTFGSPLWTYYEHFRLTDPVRYVPDIRKEAGYKPKVDPEKMRQTYDYVVLVGEKPEVLAELEKAGKVVEAASPFTVLKISKSQDDAAER